LFQTFTKVTLEEKKEAFGRLLTIMDELREGCPWDRKQTMQTLASLTVEETYELVDAIEEDNLSDVKEELGDLLLHMVFYAKIGDEKGAFDIGDALHAGSALRWLRKASALYYKVCHLHCQL